MNLLKLLCLSSLLMSLASATAQQDSLILQSKIDRVTVYPGFALVERLVLVPAQIAGSDFEVLINPLPMAAQPSSFQTQVLGQAIAVQGLELRTRMSKAADSSQASELELQLLDLTDEMVQLQAKKSGIKLQIQALQNMADYENQSTAASWGLPDGVDERLDFLRSQMTAFDSAAQRNQLSIDTLDDQMIDLRLQIDGALKDSGDKIREVIINCFAQKSAPAQIRLTYLVSGANWTPSYDLRISTDLTGVSVSFLGQVQQRTGEDWAKAHLVLSTSMPQIGLDPPDVPQLKVKLPGGSNKDVRGNSDYKFGGRADLAASRAKIVDYGITTQFVLPGKIDVLANGDAHRFPIRTVPLEVSPERYIVPSQSTNAYLRAEVKHTGDSLLLPGTAKIFLGPDYLGESSFPLLRQGDSTTLNLGIDPNLDVVCETIQDYRDDPGSFSLSSTSTITRRYRASLRLAPSAHGAISVVLEESIPVSSADKVEVEVGEISPQAVADDLALARRAENGVYQWRFTLQPSESKVVLWGYELSFNEEMNPVVSEN
ncbi:MAG: DUF4139 domain-containing protein [Planctomycetes bacterium]|nr:DUF4139 domain-containing protein [Planctomycetota bacterium]